jgi:hypothetical protein
LQRSVDPAGLVGWGSQLDQGMPRQQVVLGIENSVEHRTREVETAYEQLLGRPADSAGLAAFVQFLQTGGTIEQVEATLAGSAEYFQDRAGGTNEGFLSALYQAALDRGVDAAGRSAFDQLLANGASRTQVAEMIFSSPEYQQDLVEGLYQRFLGRAADEAGLSFYESQLAQGATDEQVIALILGSGEYFSRV